MAPFAFLVDSHIFGIGQYTRSFRVAIFLLVEGFVSLYLILGVVNRRPLSTQLY